MKKYEIYTERFELRFGTGKSSIPAMSADDVWDSYMAQSCHEPRLEATYDTLEEAREALKAYRVSTRAEASSVFWLLVGDVAYIQESISDDVDEFDQGCIYDYAAEAYTSVEDREEVG